MLAILLKVIIGWLTHKAIDKGVDKFRKEKTMTCPTCHATGQAGTFCSNCGNSLAGPPVPAPVPAPAPVVPAPAPPIVPPTPAPATPAADPAVAALQAQVSQLTNAVNLMIQAQQATPPAPVVPATPPTAHKKPGFWHQLKQGLDKIDETTGFKKSH